MAQPPPPEPPWSPWLGRVRGELRASDTDREQTVVALQEHQVQGRLSAEELGERTRLAYQARTRGELAELLVDLPGPSPGTALVTQALQALRPAPPFPGLAYAGFWPRAGALWADIIAIGAVGYGVEAVAGSVVGGDIVAAGGLAYFIVLWATTGRTLGMWLAGLRVVRQDSGRRLGLARSVIRMAGFFLNAASVFVGFAWAGVDRRKQGWHDKMAGSLVVRRID